MNVSSINASWFVRIFLSSSSRCAFAAEESLARALSRLSKVARSDIILRSSSAIETLCAFLQGSETIRGVICAIAELVKQIDSKKNDASERQNIWRPSDWFSFVAIIILQKKTRSKKYRQFVLLRSRGPASAFRITSRRQSPHRYWSVCSEPSGVVAPIVGHPFSVQLMVEHWAKPQTAHLEE